MNDQELNIDLDSATLEELENLSLDQLLGQDIADVNLTSSLPDGTFIFFIDDFDKKVYAAKPEAGKKASIALNVKLKVHSAQHLTDPNIDPETMANRVHFQRFFITSEMGQAQLVKLLLGIVGVKFSDKEAIKQIGRSPIALLEELKANKVYFGATVKNTERDGYENSDIVYKEKNFISMEQAHELIA